MISGISQDKVLMHHDLYFWSMNSQNIGVYLMFYSENHEFLGMKYLLLFVDFFKKKVETIQLIVEP